MPEKSLISTKANTLLALSNLLKESIIEEMYILLVGDYNSNPDLVCEEIMTKFNGCRIVVRSSTSTEDRPSGSNAGRYKSILDVDSKSGPEIHHAILEVIRSYENDIRDVKREQILIQRQATDVLVSGVVFTRELHGNRPFYLINYDDSGSTDSVTGGSGGSTLWISRDRTTDSLPSPWDSLIRSVREIERLLEAVVLDIEFAIKKDGRVILFQVRPLTASYRREFTMSDREFFELKNRLKEEYTSKKSSITGKTMLLSDMAFWNPSEIIGSNPRTLDYELYREILTSHQWNDGIRKLGFRATDEELMYRVGNKPYISLEASFYALTPQAISEELAVKLVDFYSKRLKNNLTAHDKIEFEIVFSTYDFMTEKDSLILLENGFSQEERTTLLEELKRITVETVKNYYRYLKNDRRLLEMLDNERVQYENNLKSGYGDCYTLVSDILGLLHRLGKYGTEPFARQARMAFMARAFWRSLVTSGTITEAESDAFMQTVSTVSSEFDSDFELFSSGEMSSAEFNKKYGHLRSGTYDIRTDRYDKINFRPLSSRSARKQHLSEKPFSPDKTVIQSALDRAGIDITADELFDFSSSAIREREYFKFEFTKTLSLILEMILKFGEITDIKRHDLSWLSPDDFRRITPDMTPETVRRRLQGNITEKHDLYGKNLLMLLPEVIEGELSLDVISVYEARPNFITSKKVEGEVVFLENEENADVTDKIVAVTKADPGYEWIFAKGIRGFITKYGGAASHMAIRCAEFEIPAAIGCGEKIYSEVLRMNYVKLDCGAGKIEEGIQYRNLSALITQREGVNQYGDPTDILETAYIRFYELLGFIPKAVSNNTKDIDMVFSKKRDLLIVVGGGALPPYYYDRPHSEELQPQRDITEEKLIRYCISRGIPVIATCRGMQYVNVLFGGKLSYHPNLMASRPRGVDHPVRLVKENRTIMVNNYHADVIFRKGLADCFTPVAIDEENDTVEAFESEQMKLLAIQWHPERKFETPGAAEETRKIIIDFIQKYIK
ncbi:MAG: gamma-glutamyl-gamma-aminobutyrate hydrolase family protein [Clostridia bacterium]|nr:gamma-glutamyl-gamma-aminobutyrate hydrolase family protein [Clostridia bacterium]